MSPAIRLLVILIAFASALVPVSLWAGPDMDRMIARMLVGKAGVSTDIILNPETRALEVRTFGFNGGVMRKDVVRLNAAGEPIAWQMFDAKGKLRYRVLYAFDRMGRRSSAVIYNNEGKMVHRGGVLR